VFAVPGRSGVVPDDESLLLDTFKDETFRLVGEINFQNSTYWVL
jgi:hypothetical protein